MEHPKEVDMNKIIPFDTLAYAKKLESHGVIPEHAAAHAEGLAEVLEGNFPTKQETLSTVDKVTHRIDLFQKDVDARFYAVHQKMDAGFDAANQKMDAGFDAVHKEMDARFDAVHQKMDAGFDAVHKEMDARFDAVHQKMDAGFAAVRSETKTEFAVVRKELSDTRSELIKWMVGIALSQLAIIVPIIFTIVKYVH